ncbi:hypothetical protein M885DRAFT_618284 [Pelagophyceae sp. CCMP2097]|nr:hypothetical protein M885DRAFT_618284 [Pelagophyceae sp. CCMP2097]
MALLRLRRLQASLFEPGSDDGPSALLFVAGVDGRDNWGSAAILRWLALGESGVGLLEQSARPFDIADDAVYEGFEETMLLVSRRSLCIYYDPRAEQLLEPLLTAPGVAEYTVALEAAGLEAAEDVKVAAFQSFISKFLKPGQTVGVVKPSGADGAAEDVEYWPMVQAFAAVNSQRGEAKPFFTMRYDVVDATARVSGALVACDGPALRALVDRATNGLRHHFDDTWRAITGESMKARLPLTTVDCAERFEALFDYARPDGADVSTDISAHRPFALLGAATASLAAARGAAAVLAAESVANTANSSHVVLQAVEPCSGVAACRTYLLSNQGEAAQTYARLVHLMHTDVATAVHALACGADARSAITKALRNDSVRVDCEALRESPALVYVRLSSAIFKGAVAVGDTFICGQALEYLSASRLPQSPRLLQGECGLVTGDRCAPYWRMLLRGDGPAGESAAELTRQLRDPHAARDALALGRKIDAFAAATVLVGVDSQTPRAYTGKLEVFESGFAVLDAGVGPLVVSLARGDARRISVRERGGQAVLLLDLQGPQLQGAVPEKAAPFFVAALVVKARSEADSAMRNLLVKWRSDARVACDVTEDDLAGPICAFEAAFDEIFNDQNQLLPAAVTPAPPVEALLAAFARRADAAVVEKLAGGPWTRVAKKAKVALVVALLGLPGSGVGDVAAGVASRGREDDGLAWRLVRVAVDWRRGAVDRGATVDLLKRAVIEASKAKQRLLVTACCCDSAPALASILREALGDEAFTVGAVVSSAQLSSVGEARWPLGVWDQCASGADALVFVDGGDEASLALQRRIRAAKRGSPTVVRASRGARETAAVAKALLSPVSLRVLEGVPADAGLGRRQCVRVAVDFVIEKTLFVECLSVLLPRAKATTARFALAPAPAAPQCGSALKTLFSLAAAKVNQKRDLLRRHRGWPARIGAWRKHFPEMHVEAVVGNFAVGGVANGVALDANHSVYSLWSTYGPLEDAQIVFFGDGLDAAALEALVALAATTASLKQAERTRASVTAEEVKRVLARAVLAETPLPPGYAFDGRSYVDETGMRSMQRPDVEELILVWLAEQNE